VTKILYAFPIFAMYAACPNYMIFLNLIALTIFAELYKL
jgi:hypothetical protein